MKMMVTIGCNQISRSAILSLQFLSSRDPKRTLTSPEDKVQERTHERKGRSQRKWKATKEQFMCNNPKYSKHQIPLQPPMTLHLQPTTSATTLPPGAVTWGWGDILNATNPHSRTRKSSESGLRTRAGGLGPVAWGSTVSKLLKLLDSVNGYKPPVARILMCRAVIPTSLHRCATSWAANMAAYGEDSSRSALTFIPPVTRTTVSLPLLSRLNTSALLPR